MRLALWLHVMAFVVWIGGMFFAQMVLRPAVPLLAPPQRLPLMAAVMGRFLAWAGAAIMVLFASGVTMMLGGGPPPRAVQAMAGIACVMVVVYVVLVTGPYQRLRRRVAASDWPAAGAAMAGVRPLVLVNLLLGIGALAAALLLR